MRPLPLALALALLLAGCSGPRDAKTQSAEDIDFGDVQATATTGVIRGVVVDTGIRPLQGATILVTSPVNRTTTTGADGQFAFADLAPGTYFMQVSLANYTTVQQSAEVVAGESEPPITKVQLERLASTLPYVEAISKAGFITFGASIGITSIGSTFFGGIGDDDAIWNVAFTQVPTWAQGELVWDQTQPAGGMLIWEMVHGGTNDFHGHRETNQSPALAYWPTSDLLNESANVTTDGIDYRFFGGPHPALAPNSAGGPTPPEDQCPVIPTVVLGDRNPCRFGFGLTAQQRAEGYIHNFYNFAPPAGWRFTVDGDPDVPPA
jgi:hypothetical protein